MKKTLWPIFSRIIECDKPQGTICKGPKDFLVVTLELIRELFKDLWGFWKHKLLKKNGNISNEKNIVAYFFS